MNKVKDLFNRLESKIVLPDNNDPLIIFDFDNICIGVVRRHGQPSMLLRPGSQEILEALKKAGNLVVYTTMPKLQADLVIGSVTDAPIIYWNSGIKKFSFEPNFKDLSSFLPKFRFSGKLNEFNRDLYIFSEKQSNISGALKDSTHILVKKWIPGNTHDRVLEQIVKYKTVDYEDKFFDESVKKMPNYLVKKDLLSLTTPKYDSVWFDKMTKI